MAQLPNPFLHSTATPEPPAVGTAGASQDLQPRAPAELPSESTLDPATGVDTTAGPEFADPQVPAAVLIAEPPSNEGRSEETPASAPSKNPDVGVLGTDCISEIFHYARKLSAEARWFVPDYPDIYQAMLDPNAPRALETDPVWADDPPLFLQRQEA